MNTEAIEALRELSELCERAWGNAIIGKPIRNKAMNVLKKYPKEQDKDPLPDYKNRLVGRLVFAGDLEINGEEISGCALEIDRSTLISANQLPMYQDCIILPLDI